MALVLIGVTLGFIGTDTNSGRRPLHVRADGLLDGLQFVPLALGFFGIPEIISNLENPESRNVLSAKVGSIWPSWKQIRLRSGDAAARHGPRRVLGVLPAAARC